MILCFVLQVERYGAMVFAVCRTWCYGLLCLPSHILECQLITSIFSIRIDNNAIVAIDNISVDNSALDTPSISSIINGLSDHDMQILTIDSVYSTINKFPLRQTTRLINNEHSDSAATIQMEICL